MGKAERNNMMSGDKELPFSELNLADVDFTPGKNTGWGWGGNPSTGEWTIYFVDKDLNQTTYRCPPCINTMVQLSRKFAVEDQQRKLRIALSNALGKDI
jgi:hypothetical protein